MLDIKITGGRVADIRNRQLKSVDVPTFGSPTIPHFNAIVYKRLYIRVQNYDISLNNR